MKPTEKRLVRKLTCSAFRRLVTPKTVVIVPFGALESHGSHLPLGADTFQAEAVAVAVSRRTGALVAPAVPYGVCPTFASFPGTVSLSFDTFRDLAREILEGFARHGVRRVLCLTGHGSATQVTALREAARSVADSEGMRVFVLSDYDVARQTTAGAEPALGGHAGALETSRLLAIQGHLVEGAPSVRYVPPPPWEVSPDPSLYFPDGVRGDPSLASREAGEAIQAEVVDRVVELVEELSRG